MQPASLNFVVREPGESVRLRLHLLTPMLGGGPEQGKPDPEQPFRAKSIRGQLRWWYRRVIQVADAKELWEREAALFGSAGRDADDTTPGKVRIAVDQGPPGARKAVNALEQHRYAWGLFAKEAATNEVVLSHSALVTVSGLDPDALAALAAWLYFGGIGARTRRGFGSLRWVEEAGHLPSYEETARRLAKGCGLRIAGGSGVTVLRHGRLPVASEAGWSKAAMDAWKEALAWYEAFRKGNLQPGLSRAPRGPESHSRWPEANSVRLRQRQRQTREAEVQEAVFPRASLGLPMAVRSAPKSVHSFNNVELEVEGGGRWPSTVITKAVFRGEAVEPTIAVLRGGGPRPDEVVSRGGRTFHADSLSAKGFPTEWFDGRKFQTIPEIEGNTARDKLISYLKYAKRQNAKAWEEVK
ncbi:MAG TPA: type III-B CRISPR module RAMP protein Cmr1 [Armatimonadetes bacterium]|nr:type III-B CRISPR module RAMP protein Cmr1 [Armatimonadota bacterium]